jgi:Tol biopolymer transport system component
MYPSLAAVSARPRLAATLALVAASTVAAELDAQCALDQLSTPAAQGVFSNQPHVSADGHRIVFTSAGNFTGQNVDGSGEVFYWNVTTQSLQQISNGTAGRNCGEAFIAGNGNRVAYACNHDQVGANADGSYEVFVYDVASTNTTQVTINPPPVSHEVAAISTDGTRLAVVSDADYTGGNPDLGSELYVIDLSQGTKTQVTACVANPGSTTPAAFDASGDLLVYDHECGFADNADGNDEVLLYDVPTATTQRLTNNPQGSGFPRISGDGRFVTFGSQANPGGSNPDGTYEVFRLDLLTQTLQQITAMPAPFDSVASAISDDGSRILFLGEGAMTPGDNNGVQDLHVWEEATGTFRRLTTSEPTRDSFNADMSADGSTAVLVSFSDFTGENPDHALQVFASDITACGVGQGVVTVPTLSGVGGALLALALAGAAAVHLRRRRLVTG